MDEKPKAVIKRPVGGPASYIKHNMSIIDGKVVENKSFKTFAEEENEKISRAYKKVYKDKAQDKEDIKKIREENAKRREEKAKRKAEDEKNTKKYVASLKEKEALTEKSKKTSPSAKKVNLFDELKVNDENKNILLDVINYSLNEREKRVLKDYYGTYYDGLNRKTNSKEGKNNASVVVKKLKISLKEAMAIYDNRIKYRIFLLSFKNELEYVSQDVFKNISKTVLKQAYKKLTVVESRVALDYFNPEKAEELSDEELIIFTNDIFPKLKVYVFNPRGIDAYFKAFKEDEQKILRDVFSIVINDDKVILKKKFGSKLDGNNKKRLSKQEYIYFRHTIFVKMEKKYQELLKLKGSTDYYISLIKGFSKITLEKHCSIKDKVDKKILLTLLESLNEDDKEILFTTNNLDKMNRNKLSYERDLILSYLKNNIKLLKKVYNDKESYNELLEKLLNGKQIRKIKQEQMLKKNADQIKTLKEYLDLNDEDAKNIELAISTLIIEHIELLQKMFGSLYDGVESKSITRNEKLIVANTIKPKLLKTIQLINVTDEKDLANELDKLTSKNKFGYQVLSLYDALSLSLDDKELLINAINKIFNKEEISLLQKRFGPNYDGVGITGITKEENKHISECLIPRLKWEINKKLGIVKKEVYNYKVKSLFKHLNVDEKDKHILLDIMNILSLEDQQLFQRRFGPLYDGKDVKEITEIEKNRIFHTLIPKVKKMFSVLSETPIDQYAETLKKVTCEYQKKTKKRKNSTLTSVTTIEEFEKEQSKEDPPKTTFQKVVAVEEVEVREQKVNKEDESINYIKNLLEILEEEKKDLFKNYREKLQYFKHNMALLTRKLKIYSQELSSYGFTEKEGAFLLLSTTEGLDLSNIQLMSILKIQKEELREIYQSSTYKILNLISSELDSYISLLKEMRDNNE